MTGFFSEDQHAAARPARGLPNPAPCAKEAELRQADRSLAPVILLGAAFLLVFGVLYLARTADDNSLFSWTWIFSLVSPARIYLLLAAGLIAAGFLSRIDYPRTCDIPVLAALSLLAVVPLWAEPELIIDASRYFIQAKQLELYGITNFFSAWGKGIFAWTDLPLVPFLYGLVLKLSGESRTAVQLFVTALFSGAVVLTYLIGKRLWDRDTGLCAGFLLIGMPYLLAQVPLMLVDVPTMFFFLLAVYLFIIVLQTGSSGASVLSVAAIVCAVLSKYSALPMLTILPVILGVSALAPARNGSNHAVRMGLLVLTASAVFCVVLFLFKSDVVREQIALLREYQQPGLSRWSESHVSTFFFQIHPFITAAAAGSVLLAIRRRDARYLVICWLVLLVVLFGIRRIRYILPAFPMISLMAAYGIQVVTNPRIRRFLIYGTAAVSMIVAAFVYLPFAEQMSAGNLKAAGAYLDQINVSAVRVITIQPDSPVGNIATSVPLLDFFTRKPLQYDYKAEGFPPENERLKAPLRFTWLYRNPPFYEDKKDANCNSVVVLLSAAESRSLPDAIGGNLRGYYLVRSYMEKTDPFLYSTGIRIYQKISGIKR